MQKMNNLGFSSILQVTILSALSIISLFLVFGYIKELSFDLNNQLSPTINCISQKSEVVSACLNQDGKVELNINLGLEERITDLSVNLQGELFKCGISCQSCNIIEKEGNNIVYINPKNSPEELVASINNCNPEKVQISKC